MSATLTGNGYRFDHPTMGIVLSDMKIPRTDPRPGDAIPRFSVTTTDAITIDNASLRRDGRPALIVFGSLTCPVTESAGDGLRELATRYGDRVRFILINVREAHPGASTPQPQTDRQKSEHALRLKEHHRLPFEVATDDLDGTLHRAFGPRPSSAYLVDPVRSDHVPRSLVQRHARDRRSGRSRGVGPSPATRRGRPDHAGNGAHDRLRRAGVRDSRPRRHTRHMESRAAVRGDDRYLEAVRLSSAHPPGRRGHDHDGGADDRRRCGDRSVRLTRATTASDRLHP
jgi:Iodothyronine deiodinase